MMKMILPIFALLITSTARAESTEPAEARNPPSTLEVTVSLIEPRGQERRMVFEAKVQITDGHGCSKVSAHLPTIDNELAICREGGTDQRPVLSVSVMRMLRGDADDRREARMSAAIAPGKKVVIGKITNTSGTLEIEAKVDVTR